MRASNRETKKVELPEQRNFGARVLYLSYDGMCDPLGGSQVLPYLTGLAKCGHHITLISFEKPERTKEERMQVMQTCTASGIRWHPLPYHKRPPLVSSMYDVRKMRILAEFLHRLAPFDLLHCRSYLPALVGLKLKRRRGVPFIFDMRGFWADERIEGGGWERNCAYRTVYRYFKTRERHFLNEADEIVSLTWAGKQVLSSCGLSAEAHVTVIPCCADFDAFPAITSGRRMQARKALGIGADEKVLGYIGSLGGNYMLNEMIDFFCTYRMRYHDARFLFVTHVPEELMRVEAAKHSLPDDAIIVRQATHTQVPLFMAAADHGIAFKKPLFSAKACSPTKLGEMLAMELPVIVNSGVGDVAQVVEETGAGNPSFRS